MSNEFVFMVAILAVLVSYMWRQRQPRARATSRLPWVIDAFRVKLRRQGIMAVLLTPVVLFLLISAHDPGSGQGKQMVVVVALVIVALAGLVYSLAYWRCPACGAYLGKYAWMKGVCPKCGTAFK